MCNLVFMTFYKNKASLFRYTPIIFLFCYFLLAGLTTRTMSLPAIQPSLPTAVPDSTTPRQTTVTRTGSNVESDDSDQGVCETTGADDSDQNGSINEITTTARSSDETVTHPELPKQEDDGYNVNLFIAKPSQMFLFLNWWFMCKSKKGVESHSLIIRF